MQNISLLISLSQRWLLLSFLCIFSENKLYVKYGSIYLLLTEKNHYRHLYTLQFFTFFPNHDIQIYLIHCDGCILFHCMDGTLFKHHCTDSLIFYSFCFLCPKTPHPRSQRFSPIFNLTINGFWLNLHALRLLSSSFIYVVTTDFT